MTSQRQIQSNRNNAQHSTGPKTPRGKLRVALNPLKHGIYSKLPILPNIESLQEWEDFLHSLLDTLRPDDPFQRTLTTSIAQNLWRIQRIRRFELTTLAPAFQAAINDYPQSQLDPEQLQTRLDFANRILETLLRIVAIERTLNRASRRDLKTIRQLKYSFHPSGSNPTTAINLEDINKAIQKIIDQQQPPHAQPRPALPSLKQNECQDLPPTDPDPTSSTHFQPSHKEETIQSLATLSARPQ